MSSRLKGIIAGAIVLLALVGVLIWVMLLPSEEEKQDAGSDASQQMSSLIYDKNPQDIVTLSIENEYGSYKIEKLSDGLYIILDYAYIPLDSYRIQQMLENAASITVQQTVLENAEEFSKYGLDKPRATVSASFGKDGEDVKEFIIGNETPTEGKSYFAFKGEKTVYTINDDAFQLYLADKTVCFEDTVYTQYQPSDKNDTTNYKKINKITIERKDLDSNMVIEYDDRKADTDMTVTNVVAYKMIEPIKVNLDSRTCRKVTEDVFGLTAAKVAAVAPNDEQLAEYGLTDPFAKVTMDIPTGDFAMIIGNEYTNESEGISGRYCYVKGIDVVYVFNNDSLPWATVKPVDIIIKKLTNNDISTVSSIDFDDGNKITKITVTGDSEENLKAKLDGKDMDSALFKNFYKFIISGNAEEVYTEDTNAKADFIMTVKSVAGTDTIEFIPSGNRKTIVKINGKVSFKCKTAFVDRLKENLELVRDGQNIVTSY